MDFSTCPIDKANLDQDMKCPQCKREWYKTTWDGEEILASKPRRIRLKGPIERGKSLEDIIEPIEDE